MYYYNVFILYQHAGINVSIHVHITHSFHCIYLIDFVHKNKKLNNIINLFASLSIKERVFPLFSLQKSLYASMWPKVKEFEKWSW